MSKGNPAEGSCLKCLTFAERSSSFVPVRQFPATHGEDTLMKNKALIPIVTILSSLEYADAPTGQGRDPLRPPPFAHPTKTGD